MFKSAAIFKITMPEIGASAAFEQAQPIEPFTPCGLTEERSVGWVPPRGHENGAMIEYINGQIIMRLMIETKTVPAQAINDVVDAECKAIEAMTGRKPGKKEKRDLKDDAKLNLLPHAFPARAAVTVWIDLANHRLVLDTSSQSRCDTVVTKLVQLIDGLEVQYLQTNTSPTAAMASWLFDNDTLGLDFSIGRACVLKASDETKAVVRYGRHRLDTDEVHQHIKEGKMPTELALNYMDRVDFVLTDDGNITKLNFLDCVFEDRDKAVDNFDADVAIVTGELTRVIDGLLEELGGMEGGAA
jgi:recombination associated protein RdgC